MRERWSEGLWMGKATESDEHVVWPLHGAGPMLARTVRVRDAQVTRDQISSINIRPGETLPEAPRVEQRGPQEIELHPEAAAQPVHEPDLEAHEDFQHGLPRKWQITREVFVEYGATQGCPKCLD